MSERITKEDINCTEERDESSATPPCSPTTTALNPFETNTCLKVKVLLGLGNPAEKRLLEIKANAQAMKTELMGILDAAQDYSTMSEIPSDQEYADEGTFNVPTLKKLVEAYCGNSIARYKEFLELAQRKPENADILVSYKICTLIRRGEIVIDEKATKLKSSAISIEKSKNFQELEKREINNGIAQIPDTKGKLNFLKNYSRSWHASDLAFDIKRQAEIAEIERKLDNTADPIEQMAILSQINHNHAKSRKEEIRSKLLADALTSEETPNYLTMLDKSEIDFGNDDKRLLGTMIVGEAEHNDKIAIVDLHNSSEIGTIDMNNKYPEVGLDPQFVRDALSTAQYSATMPGKIFVQVVKLVKSSLKEMGRPQKIDERIKCNVNPDSQFPPGSYSNQYSNNEYYFKLSFKQPNGSKEQSTAATQVLIDTQQKIEDCTRKGRRLKLLITIPETDIMADEVILVGKQMMALKAA